MDALKIEPAKTWPAVFFDANHHKLDIRGESYPENTSDFYRPVFEWLEAYLDNFPDTPVTVNVDLIYFNSSSSKILMDFLFKLDQAAEKGKPVTVNWFYEEDTEESLEYGEEFQEDVEHLIFQLLPKAEG
ncbi:MAG: DUF1987 domain-containing protein [Desulfamplus sp.]|nr:DUF1987 domain-containing protein [Desulfamplus sp.]